MTVANDMEGDTLILGMVTLLLTAEDRVSSPADVHAAIDSITLDDVQKVRKLLISHSANISIVIGEFFEVNMMNLVCLSKNEGPY